MFRLYDPRAEVTAEVPRAHPRLLGLRARGGLRAYLVADVVRRLAEHRKLQVRLDTDASPDVESLNVYPADAPPPRVDLDVLGAGAEPDPAAGRALRTAKLSLEPGLVPALGVDPLAVRLAVLTVRYRMPIDLDRHALRTADACIRDWRAALARWAESPSAPLQATAVAAVVGALEDDLDVGAALGVLDRLGNDPAVPAGARFETFAYVDRLLGLDLAREVGRS